jgi:hypothetical protein
MRPDRQHLKGRLATAVTAGKLARGMRPSRIGTAVLCLLVALSTMLPVGTLFRCRMDGSVHLACCCEADAEPAGKAGCPLSGCHRGCCDATVLPPRPHQAMPAIDDHQVPLWSPPGASARS